MANRNFFEQIDQYLDGDLEELVKERFERALHFDEALQMALEIRQREKLAMDRLEYFLDDSPELEPARKTWLRALFSTVMVKGNFSSSIYGYENPRGLRRSDEEKDSIPGVALAIPSES